MVGRGRNDEASLLSLQVLHRAAVICHLYHEAGGTVLSFSLLKLILMSPNIILPFFFSITILSFLSYVHARHA